MWISPRAARRGLCCCLAVSVSVSLAAVGASSPQEPSGTPATSLTRVRKRLDTPPAPPLTPSAPVPLRPTFRSKIDQHVFVITLEEDLHRTFDLNELQRQSAAWSAQCCGVDLGALIKKIDKALDERRVRKTREQIARELAELEARIR